MIHENLYKGKIHFALGDQVKKMLLSIAISCLLVISFIGTSVAADSQPSEVQVLYSYEGNLSEKMDNAIRLPSLIGDPSALFMAEAVKFKAPKNNWKISAVQLLCFDGFNGSMESIPQDKTIGLEIRDKDKNLLYKYADSILPYSNYARNATFLFPLTIEIPQIPVSDEFYVCFYDRGAVLVGLEYLNETSNNSFIYVEKELAPAALPDGKGGAIPINWLIAVSGR